MNKQAFEILTGLGLPTPKTYSLQEVSAGHDSDVFYLRFNKNTSFRSGIVPRRKIITSISDYEKMLINGDLLLIEEVVPSIFGAALYVEAGYVYGEIVRGHLIGLLRRGFCGSRFLFPLLTDGPKTIERTFQQFYCIQTESGYKIELNDPFYELEPAVELIKKELLSKLPRNVNNLLLEVLITDARILYCDAKFPQLSGFMNFVQNFFLRNKYTLLTKDKSCRGYIMVDEFDIDLHPEIENHVSIVARNGALLSHFITRNWNKINDIILFPKNASIHEYCQEDKV